MVQFLQWKFIKMMVKHTDIYTTTYQVISYAGVTLNRIK
ncbi:hypothetical protein KL86DYS2_10970 [uncultured Dysgonomonas sp.]|uniref:Uncharacterized protein n=1 Tax=uncultured Dysgonomonas sp. TaxID=206096 RepID=A0A212J983_9BACT|nr:hypothetical protein KL86DYS2_10970 [uncultured Dysgonomonas sp.]